MQSLKRLATDVRHHSRPGPVPNLNISKLDIVHLPIIVFPALSDGHVSHLPGRKPRVQRPSSLHHRLPWLKPRLCFNAVTSSPCLGTHQARDVAAYS